MLKFSHSLWPKKLAFRLFASSYFSKLVKKQPSRNEGGRRNPRGTRVLAWEEYFSSVLFFSQTNVLISWASRLDLMPHVWYPTNFDRKQERTHSLWCLSIVFNYLLQLLEALIDMGVNLVHFLSVMWKLYCLLEAARKIWGHFQRGKIS